MGTMEEFTHDMIEATKTEVWYLVLSGGDGSAYPHWYLTEADTEFEADYDLQICGEGMGETCNGRVETYVDSNIHKYAVEGSKEVVKIKSRFDALIDSGFSEQNAYKFLADTDWLNHDEFMEKLVEKLKK